MAETALRHEDIQAQRGRILRAWHEAILAGYPPESRGFLAVEGDRFRNPMGAILDDGLAALHERLLDPGVDLCCPEIDRLARLFVVQGTPIERILLSLLAAKPFVDPGLGRRVDELAARMADRIAAARLHLVEVRSRERGRGHLPKSRPEDGEPVGSHPPPDRHGSPPPGPLDPRPGGSPIPR